MQYCNGRQAVMSALEALDLAGKGLNAFSVLFFFSLFCVARVVKVNYAENEET
jgi:hypothetical protein